MPRRRRAVKNDVVPFGKYKDQPVEILAADREYCEWLTGQSWFVERYRDVYNIVVNYGGTAQDTPDHNQLQAKFLDDALCLRLAHAVYPFQDRVDDAIEAAKDAVQKDKDNALSLWNRLAEQEQQATKEWKEATESWQRTRCEWDLKAIRERATGINTIMTVDMDLLIQVVEEPQRIVERTFESSGWDVVFAVAGRTHVKRYQIDLDGTGITYRSPVSISWQIDDAYEFPRMHVECKPVIGDDYPAIIRQIKNYELGYRSGFRILVFERFQARGASYEQVKSIFASSQIHVVKMEEIRGTNGPT